MTVSILTVSFGLIFALPLRLSTDSQLKQCGCYFKMVFKSKLSADCSNQSDIDFKCLSESEPYEILLKNNNYTEVPFEMFEHSFNKTLHIDLSENFMERIPDKLLKHCVSLKSLNLSHNNLTNMKDLFFIDCNINVTISNNQFKCDCNDSDNILVYNHAKELGIDLTCYSPIFGRYIPLTAKCHAQFNADEPREGKLPYCIKLFSLTVFCSLFSFAALKYGRRLCA